MEVLFIAVDPATFAMPISSQYRYHTGTVRFGKVVFKVFVE
jgi:hypothetical protein